jgi:hypothetical protein
MIPSEDHRKGALSRGLISSRQYFPNSSVATASILKKTSGERQGRNGGIYSMAISLTSGGGSFIKTPNIMVSKRSKGTIQRFGDI